jgi:glycosyltransferase involved in cell wall biosynthesis
MHLDQITPLILTYNEEPNIDRTLSKLTWASQILIIDSYSDDRTIKIAESYPQTKILQRQFDTHTNQ